jgi:PAS domain S-box-containing protein
MLWDTDDRLVLWNERMASYHPDPGVFREGLPFEELIAAPWRDIRARTGEAAAEQWLSDRRRQHRESSGYHEFQGLGGRWFVLTARRTPEGFTVTLLTDVTERQQSEERLRASEGRYKTLVELSPDAVYVHRGGRLIVCNEAAVALFGAASADELIGGDSLDLVHPEYRDQVRRLQRTSARAGTRTASGRQKRLRCDGSWFWAEVSAGAIEWDGERSAIVVVRDATEQIAAEEALVRGKEEAELANRSKTEFLANMSHELRTPLNAIIGFSDLMQREMLGPLGNDRYRGYLRDIYQSGSHLHDMINDILDLSKIEAGQLELRAEPVNVRMAIKRCIRLVAARAEEAGLKLVSRIADGLPEILADERKVKQIMINLLSNAVKFTEDGGTITIDAFPAEAGGVVLRVSDTGIGMDAADIPRALTPFMQIDSALSRRHEGTGLGLPLTKSLAELHGGTLTLESAPGQGTTVTVFLPAARPAFASTAAE